MEHEQTVSEAPGIDSFFDELDGLFAEFTGDNVERRDDDAIMARIAGVFDEASEYYSQDLNRTALLVGALSLQLSQMVCNDDHFALEISRQFGTDNPQGGGHDHHGHDHDSIDGDKKDSKTTKAKAAARLGFYSALFAYKPVRPKINPRSLYKAAV